VKFKLQIESFKLIPKLGHFGSFINQDKFNLYNQTVSASFQIYAQDLPLDWLSPSIPRFDWRTAPSSQHQFENQRKWILFTRWIETETFSLKAPEPAYNLLTIQKYLGKLQNNKFGL